MGRPVGSFALVTLLFVVGCVSDEPTSPNQPVAVQSRVAATERHVDPPGAIPTFPEFVDYAPSMVLSGVPPPLLSDAELVRAIAAVQGRAFVGFKPRNAQRAHEAGRTPAISKAQYLEGRAEVERLGARVTRTYRNLPFVEVAINPS